MNSFFSMLPDLFSSVSDFLMSEPICYFVGIMLVTAIAGLVRYIMFGRSK